MAKAVAVPRYYSPLDKPPVSPTPSGEPTYIKYQERINSSGSRFLEEVGKSNMYDLIQSSLEQSLIANVVRRVIMGDTTMFVERQFLDFVDMPKDYLSMQNNILALKQYFETLPLDIRASYEHNPEKYILDVGSDQWFATHEGLFQKMYPDSNSPVIDTEVPVSNPVKEVIE